MKFPHWWYVEIPPRQFKGEFRNLCLENQDEFHKMWADVEFENSQHPFKTPMW